MASQPVVGFPVKTAAVQVRWKAPPKQTVCHTFAPREKKDEKNPSQGMSVTYLAVYKDDESLQKRCVRVYKLNRFNKHCMQQAYA